MFYTKRTMLYGVLSIQFRHNFRYLKKKKYIITMIHMSLHSIQLGKAYQRLCVNTSELAISLK